MFLRLLPILGITFIDILGFSILIPLLPFFVKKFGASDFTVGAVFATYSLCQLVAGPVWGNVSDRIGRKTVLIVSQAGATLAWLLLGFAPSLAWVFASRALEGFSGGNLGVTQAYVGDLVPPEKRGQAFAYVGAAFSLGFVFGPALGGWLATAYGYALPFLVAAGLQLVTLGLTIVLLPESRAGATEEAKNAAGLRDIARSLADRRVAPVLWLRLVYVLGMYGWFGAMALILNRQLGWGVAQTAYVFAAFGVLQVLLSVALVGRITGALGNRHATNLGLLLCTVAFALVPWATAVPLALAVLLLFGIGISIENAAFPALASDVAPDDRRGTVLGVVSGLDSLAGFVMPPVVTGVLGAFGVGPAAAIVAALVGGATVLGVVQTRNGSILPSSVVNVD
ncbi:MAG: transporter, family, tetracycline resistance protein [Candidatus Eremiobacteraeota bacterium]|nr:transporter, family, tetracycline resistance protein [Candidatus Eremiobacteraeota bacterium]